MLDKPCSRLLLWTCKLAGLAPLSLGGPRGPSRSRVWELYSFVVLLALTGACISALATVDKAVQNKALVVPFTDATSILVVVTTVLVHATSLWQCGAQRAALQLLASCELLIGALTPERCRVALWCIAAQFVSWLVMQLFYVICRTFEVRMFDYQDTLQFLCDPALHLTYIQFESLALVLYLQMASVNKQLRQCLKLPAEGMSPDTLEEMIQPGPDKSKTHCKPFLDSDGSVLETVRSIRLLHHRVREACGQVQIAYGFQMLLLLMRSFVVTTTNLNIALAARGNIHHIGSLVLSCFKVVVLYLVLTAGHLVKTEAKQTAETLQLALVYHQMSTEIQRELKDFTLNLLRLPTVLSAGGLLPLDHTIVHGFLGSITTYLVIMLQFSPDSDTARLSNSTFGNNKTSNDSVTRC